MIFPVLLHAVLVLGLGRGASGLEYEDVLNRDPQQFDNYTSDLDNESHPLNHTAEYHHHGISLISWRWMEYDSISYCTLLVLLASILKIGFHHTPRLAEHFPESCVLIIFGIVMGCIVHFCFLDGTHAFPKFTNTLFFNVLLPPIVLDAAYSMYDEDFFGNLDAILMFAVIGTIFNVFLIALLLLAACAVGLLQLAQGLTFIQCLVFASIISAVDPVAVLAIFEEIHVNSVLYFLVFGESLLNDGVTIVLYNTMVILSKQEQTDGFQYLLAFVSFFTVVFGGLLVGIAMGFVNAIILRLTKKDHIRVLEPLVIVTSAYFAYILAELLHWSGIISLIGCGIMQKRYVFLNASKKSYTTVKYTVKTLASVADCIIFIFLGKVTVKMFFDLEFHPGFICCTLVLCTLVRVAGVFLLSYLTNIRRMKPISFREQFIMAYGGLRGAVSFSLAYILDESNPMKRIFLTTTLIVIFFTVFVQGGTIKILVDKLHISRQVEKDKKHIFCDVHKKTSDYVMSGMEAIVGNISIGSYFHIVQRFDERYIKKLLLRKRVTDRMTMRLEKITLNEHFARLYGPTVLIVQVEEEKMEEEKATRSRQQSVTEADYSQQQGVTFAGPEYKALPRISTANCLASLNRGFSSNAYEKYKSRKGREVRAMEGEDDFQVALMAQLKYRAMQTKDIERRLLKMDTFDLDSEGSEFDELTEICSPRGGDAGGGGNDAGDTGRISPDESVPMFPVRQRTSSSISAEEVRRQYLRAKKRFKSIQQ